MATLLNVCIDAMPTTLLLAPSTAAAAAGEG